MPQHDIATLGKHSRGSRKRGISPSLAFSVLGILVSMSLTASSARGQTAADSTIALLWTAPGDDGNVGTAARYELRYRTSSISGVDTLSWWNAATLATGLPTPSPAGSTDSVKVRGLQPVTTYYFIIRAADEIPNWSGYSNLAVKTTSGDATAPAAIADLSVTTTTGTSITVRWTAPGDDGNIGTATTYQIRYSTSPITSSNWGSATAASGVPAPASAGTVQTYSLSGLSGSRTYYIAMKAVDEVGNISSLSNVVNGTTLDVIPPAAVRDLSYLNGWYGTDANTELASYEVLASNGQ